MSVHSTSFAVIGRFAVWSLILVQALLSVHNRFGAVLQSHNVDSYQRDQSMIISRSVSLLPMHVLVVGAASTGKTHQQQEQQEQTSQKKSRFFNAKKQVEKATDPSKNKNGGGRATAASIPPSSSTTSGNSINKVNFDKLPPIESVLSELGLSHRLGHFIKAGFTETRHLLRITKMDINIMVS